MVALGLALGGRVAPVRAEVPEAPAEPAAQRAPAVVLGLDADDVVVGKRLTSALREAFAQRGLSGGKPAEFSELRLALGCRADQPVCLSKGGEVLGARRLVYGSLRETKGGTWRLELTILETESRTVAGYQAFGLEPSVLVPSSVGSTAQRVVATMMPDDPTDVPDDPAMAGIPQTVPAPAIGSEPTKKFVWGLERPTPTWKKAGFGVSAGLMAFGAAATVGMSVWLRARNVGFRKKLLAAAEESVMDDKALNDVPTSLPENVNLCNYASSRPTDPDTGEPLGEPGQVRNAGIVKLCGDANDVRQAQMGLAIFTGVAAASTLAFTVLLFVHRNARSARVARAWRRRGLQMGGAPSPGGGGWLSLGGRF